MSEVKQYFYIDGSEIKGPCSKEYVEGLNLSPGTMCWQDGTGLETMKPIAYIREFRHLYPTIPPPVPTSSPIDPVVEKKKRDNDKSHRRHWIVSGALAAIVIITVISFIWEDVKTKRVYNEVVASAYDDPNVDFQFYLDKYYRDLEFYGIIPTRPKQTTIKFADLDKIVDMKHAHAVSYGYKNDDIIEIYVNPSSWKSLGKAMRYWLMYHEFTHDLLNVSDLKEKPENYGKLMYPVLTSYEKVSMDDFIESFHAFITEYTNE